MKTTKNMKMANTCPAIRLAISLAVCIAIVFTMLAVLAPFAPASAADSDIGETPEIQFSSDAAKDLRDKAAELASPVKIYEYLRNNADYALYHGSRSGSINSFLSLRGNDVDLASALIAMYRSRGIHARYAVGTVRVAADSIMNWLGVKNFDLAVSIMKDQGIQNVASDPNKTYVDFEHVWVEALIPYGNYRGAGQDAAGGDCGSGSNCHWVSLDPSFKLRQYNGQAIDIYSSVQFDYNSYYNAIKNNDATRMNKDPLEIYEEQILNYLQTNYPGKTLDNVAYTGTIIAQDSLILPASLPYTVVSTLRRYNSVADHDAAVPATEPKKWAKMLSMTFTVSNGSITITVGGGSVLLADLATRRLTATTEINASGNPEVVVRLGGVEIARPIRADGTFSPPLLIGHSFTITVSMDGAPAPTSGGTDEIISATYSGIIGGYYLLATGGETSNWTQVHRAAQELIEANNQYKIVFNTSEAGCDITTGLNCTPYVDMNGNGVYDTGDQKLLDNKPALDALTGGLLYVAAMQYYAKYRQDMERLDALNHVKTPISGFLGVISSTYEVEYIDGTAFSVLPGGLLIDMKGITISGSWRIDQPEEHSNTHFNLIGHICSSLEHEIWQELTGYDAVSTVRGIQMALAGGATLLNPKKNSTTDTLPGLYASFGFSTGSAPSGFTYVPMSIYSTTPAAWTHAISGSEFDTFKSVVSTSTPDERLPSATYLYSPDYGHYAWCDCIDVNENQLLTWISQGYGNYDLGTQTVCSHSFSGTVNQYYSQLQSYYLYTVIPYYIGQEFFVYFDRSQGFAPSEYVYRLVLQGASSYSTAFVRGIRNDLYLRDIAQTWVEYLLPSTQTTGSTYRFMVDIRKQYETSSSNLLSLSFEIQNTSLSAGGGYVDGSQPLMAAQAIVGTSTVLPTFNNSVFTDKNTISQVNNDVIKTPSTTDPVSTVTGNNYHDETDFTIKGRGLDITFTRTYNSAPSSTMLDGPLGYGWTHSYNMKLTSNDYGICPNCTQGTGPGQRPENGNNITSSITYTDERGGQHNYLVNESTQAVTPPRGEFETLQFNTPSSGYHTITFRNGVKYIFQGASDIRTVPGRTATLYQIKDPYGNTLTFSYTSGKLTSITDNLGIAGRTGLTITYYTGTSHIKDITDWTGRKWSYTYDTSGNLASVTNPLSKTVSYSYHSGTHNLNEVTLPELRDGAQVKTAFTYYRNGKTFDYSNSLGHTETMDYDLYRKITRVTDPREFIREYEYDPNGCMTKLTEPDGGVLRFDNTSDFLRCKKTDALNYATTYSYRIDHALSGSSDTGGNVTQEKDPLTYTLEYNYGIYDQVIHSKDKNGKGRTMSYYTTTNPSTGALYGKLQSITLDSLNGTANVLLQSYTYNSDGTLRQMVEYIDPADPSRKRITDYTWQNNGLNLQSVTVSGSGQTVQTTYTYDSLGRKRTATLSRRTSQSDPTLISLTTTYDYDALDRVTRVTDPLGNYVETVYDGNGKVAQTNAYYKKPDETYDSRLIVSRTYNAADRLLTETDIYGAVTTYAYDASGNVISVTDPNGHTTRYEYDAMNRRTAVIDANGFRTETVYDLAGHPIQTINTLGKIVKTDYDALGRPVTVTDAMGYQTTFVYDANGNVTKTTDANANAGLQPKNSYNCTVYKVYDELNRVKQEVDALNNVTSYTYDLLGNITSITDTEGRVTHFDYDNLGRLVTVRDPLVETPADKVTTFTYDQAGNVLTRTRRSGAQTVYTYDHLNRLVQAQHTAPSAQTITGTIAYDIYGNKESVSNDDATYIYTYDLKNRPISKTDSRVGLSLSYVYDKAGNISSRTNYDYTTTEYRYDSANRLVAERNRAFLEVSYHYDGAGHLLDRILSNGAKTEYTWDDGGRLTSLKNTSANGTVINNTSYVRDRLGNITSQTDASGTTSFTYNALYRLTNANYPGTANDQSFTYDKVGNRKTMTRNGITLTYNYNSGNRLTNIQQGGSTLNSFVYDDDGNMTQKKNGAGTVIQSIAYDAKGRAKSITTSGVGTATDLTYDPYDYRIGKIDSTGSRKYLLEGEHLEAIVSDNNWKAMYLRGTVIDEIVNAYYFGTDGKWVNYTFHHDALQSVLGLSGHEGSVLQTISYGPFGEKIATTGNANNNGLHYTGREEDPDTGLYNYRARLYDPTIGRFITEDPKGFEAGVNFYAYVNNNPINANDPDGLETKVSIGYTKVIGPAYHQVVILTDTETGQQFATRGGPSAQGFSTSASDSVLSTSGGSLSASSGIGSSGGFGFGQIEAVVDVYNQDFRDPPAKIVSIQNVGIIERDFAESVANAFEFANVTNQNQIPYWPLGPNSNSYASTFVESLTGTRPQPILTAPGADFGRPSSNLSFTPSFLVNDAAGGGFVLYPNKPNTNMMQQVYAK
ncbi:MAG: RHS repeat-associated core domain-containing protein [Chloroflexota bacterium]